MLVGEAASVTCRGNSDYTCILKWVWVSRQLSFYQQTLDSPEFFYLIQSRNCTTQLFIFLSFLDCALLNCVWPLDHGTHLMSRRTPLHEGKSCIWSLGRDWIQIFKNMYNRQLFPKRCQCLFFKWISFSKAIDGLLLLVFSAFIHLNCETRHKFSLFICIPSPHVAVFYTLLLGCSFWAWAMSIVEITWFDFNTC